MRDDVYIENALKTESSDFGAIGQRLSNPDLVRLLHAAMGLSTEANEILDMIKKHVFYGKPLDLVNLGEELGDCDWYKAIMCDAAELDPGEIKRKNIAKLQARYPHKFTEKDAVVRDLNKERKILEGQP